MITYIKKQTKTGFITLGMELPSYTKNVGTTFDDYLEGKWVKLSEEQVNYRSSHPTASVEDVWNMGAATQKAVERSLDFAKAEKQMRLQDYDRSEEVNSFAVNGSNAWLTIEERLNYKESVNAARLLGKSDVSFYLGDQLLTIGCDEAQLLLAQIQDYADKCFIATKQHSLAIQALESVDAVDGYDFTTGYPERLTFNI